MDGDVVTKGLNMRFSDVEVDVSNLRTEI